MLDHLVMQCHQCSVQVHPCQEPSVPFLYLKCPFCQKEHQHLHYPDHSLHQSLETDQNSQWQLLGLLSQWVLHIVYFTLSYKHYISANQSTPLLWNTGMSSYVIVFLGDTEWYFIVCRSQSKCCKNVSPPFFLDASDTSATKQIFT
jgi:hypothetical protein